MRYTIVDTRHPTCNIVCRLISFCVLSSTKICGQTAKAQYECQLAGEKTMGISSAAFAFYNCSWLASATPPPPSQPKHFINGINRRQIEFSGRITNYNLCEWWTILIVGRAKHTEWGRERGRERERGRGWKREAERQRNGQLFSSFWAEPY